MCINQAMLGSLGGLYRVLTIEALYSLTLLMIEILHDLIHITLQELLGFWHVKSCRTYIINTSFE